MSDSPAARMGHMAQVGTGTLPGMVWRPGDGAKHLGPPEGLMPTWARTFQTRCGLNHDDGPWAYTGDTDDVWCAACVRQAGIDWAPLDL